MASNALAGFVATALLALDGAQSSRIAAPHLSIGNSHGAHHAGASISASKDPVARN